MPASFFPTDPDENAASLVERRRDPLRLPRRDRGEDGGRGRRLPRQVDRTRCSTGPSASSATVIAIDPRPQPDLREIAADRIRSSSWSRRPATRRCAELGAADAIIIDGDHNYFTLSEELRLIDERTRRRGDAAVDASTTSAGRSPAATPTTRRSGSRPSTASRSPTTPTCPRTSRGPRRRDAVRLRRRARGRAPERDPDRDRGLPRRAATSSVRERSRLLRLRRHLASRRRVGRARSRPMIAPWDRNPVLARLEANRIRHMVERYRMTRRLGARGRCGSARGTGGPARRSPGRAPSAVARAALAPARARPAGVHARAGPSCPCDD